MKIHKAMLILLLGALLAGCSSTTAPTETTPQPTNPPPKASSEPSLAEGEDLIETPDESDPTSIPQTEIIIDGDPSDWKSYEVLLTDPAGDHEGGGFDIAGVRAFSNNEFLYVLVEVHETPSEYAQVDLDISAGGRNYVISFGGAGPTGFMGDVTSGDFQEIGIIAGSNFVISEAGEIKIPLSAFEGASGIDVGIRPMGGECCQPPGWYAIDNVGQVSAVQLAELEPAVDADAAPRVCAENTAPPAPFGSFEAAPINFAEGGFSAEWFVEPGTFNMPQEILLTPDGRILVLAIRSHKLYQLSLDGAVTLAANDAWGYQGDVDESGNVYLHNHPEGTITRISPEGGQLLIARSSQLVSACDCGFGFGPDGNLYAAVSRCGEVSDLYQITLSGAITKVGEIPDLSALRTSPSGRFIAVGYNTIYEFSLDDYSLTELGRIPQGVVSPSGITFDNVGNLYISTGDRSTSGTLYRMSLSADQPAVEKVAEIPENGLSGIEWVPETGEIIGGQLRQGGVLGVSPDGEIREIVPGNGIITPMGMGFSPCGELAVTNDDGGMMTLVGPSGEVSWLMDYLSFTPPVPFVAFDTAGTLYAGEAAPGLFPVRVAQLPAGGQLETILEAEYPSGLATRSDGVLFVSETTAGRITQVFPDGSSEVFIDGLSYPQALALDRGGNLYAVTGPNGFTADPTMMITPLFGDRILKISPEGEIIHTLALPGAVGAAVGFQDDLFVSGGNNIIRFSSDGSQSVFASGFEHAVGLAFDLAGNLYVSDEHMNGIVRIGGFPQGSLSGAVYGASGDPVEGARVQALTSDPIVVGQVAFTDEKGEFQLAAAPGTYSLSVSAPDFMEFIQKELEVLPSQAAVVEIVLEE